MVQGTGIDPARGLDIAGAVAECFFASPKRILSMPRFAAVSVVTKAIIPHVTATA